MEMEYLCTLQNVTILKGEVHVLDNLQYDIRESVIETFISQDGSASALLKVIGGFLSVDEGDVAYPAYSPNKKDLARWIQYVPDDIICYANMKVKEFLQGVALSIRVENALEKALELCHLFEIDVEEELLELTFEKNRLVAMIQAIIAKPKLLLLDCPYDMLGKQRYGLLLKELVKLRAAGTTILIVADAYDKVIVPCDRYVFLKDGAVFAQYNRNELPRLSKVIMIENGNPAVMKKDRMKLLYRTKKRWCFVYKEDNVAELVLRIYQTGCDNFTVNELSMEEEIYGDYARWRL